MERTGDPAFGLHFARCIQPTGFGLLGYMVMNCSTIGESLDAVVKYQFLAGQGGEFSLSRQGATTHLRYTPVNPGQPVTWHRVVALLAANVSFGRWLVGEAFRPDRVTFSHAAPADVSVYEEFFASPVDFAASANELIFPGEVISKRAFFVLYFPLTSKSRPLLIGLLRRPRRYEGHKLEKALVIGREWAKC